MNIAIVTPWKNGVGTLLEDYSRAADGAIVVTVDNGSDAADADALKAYTEPRGVYIRNERNLGFAAANNQGYMAAPWNPEDVVVFLNSDVAPTGPWLEQVHRDVRDGYLYGPSLGQQFVGGMMVPYLEGWCLAATKATWDRLILKGQTGPWDAVKYPKPYWEDNDLTLRALDAGIGLVQTAWMIAHKGGATAGALVKHAQGYEANRATFARRVLRALDVGKAWPDTPIQAAYQFHAQNPSDIQHHIPTLFGFAQGNIVELGTRSGVSTAAFLAGVEGRGGFVTSVDIDPQSAQVAKGHPNWDFVQGDTTDPVVVASVKAGGPIDLLLVDTLHNEDHVARELALWSPLVRPGGRICVHDTETFPGVRTAVERFVEQSGWTAVYVLPGNGMAILERPNT